MPQSHRFQRAARHARRKSYLTVGEALDLKRGRRLLRETKAAIVRGALAIWIDLSVTDSIWSAGLAALMKALSLVRAANRRATVCVRATARPIMEVTGVARLAAVVIVSSEEKVA